MRVITWNMRRATNKRHEPWDYFNERSPDLAILQEVTSIPEDLENNYDQIYQRALGKTGREQAFGNAILVKNGQLSETKLLSEKHWINVELNNLGGHLLSAKAQVHSGIHFNVLAIHSPAWAIDKERLKEMDVSDVSVIG